MKHWAAALLLTCQAIAADAQDVPAPGPVAPTTMDRARISASPALSQAIAARVARWTLRNDSDLAVRSIRLMPEGADDFGRNLLESALAPGASRSLPRAASQCDHRIELGFANGASRLLRQNLCEDPLLRASRAQPTQTMAKTLGQTGQIASQPKATVAPPVIMPAPIMVPDRPVAPARPDAVPREQVTTAGRGPASLPAEEAAPAPAPAPIPATTPTAAQNEERAAAAAAMEAARDADESAAFERAEATPVAEPIVEAPADALIWCPELEEEVPALVCDRVRTVNQGVAGVRAKPEMVLEETQVVRLVVSRSGDAASVVDELGGEDAVYRQFELATGRYMEARLTADSGLEITPTSWVRRDLGAADLEDWEWEVKAVSEGRHRVVLRTRVMKLLPDGEFIPRPGRESEPQYVDVKITATQGFEQNIGLFTRWLDAVSAPAESLNNLLTLLTTLVVTAGGLWAAIRAFGGKGKAGAAADDDGGVG